MNTIELDRIVYQQEKTAQASLCLPIDQRIKSRFRARLDDGREVGLFLPRGNLLRHNDLLSNKDGFVVRVVAAAEKVSTAYSDDLMLLARAAYHLGNRHVPLQLETGWLRYLHDHVLDDMLVKLGLSVEIGLHPFEPEAGAYQQMTGAHQHEHHHD